MSLDFVYPLMVTPELINLHLGPLKELLKHGRMRVITRARAHLTSVEIFQK